MAAFPFVLLILSSTLFAVVVVCVQANGIDDGEGTDLFANYEVVQTGSLADVTDTIQADMTRRISTVAGERLWILDNYLARQQWEAFRSILQVSAWWGFRLTSRDGVDQAAGGDGVPWGASLSAEEIMKLPIGQPLATLATVFGAQHSIPELDQENFPAFLPSEVMFKVVRRGDLTSIHYGNTSDSDDVWMAVFLNERWQSHYHGELVWYDSDGEIVGSASHRFGRIVVWSPTLGYLCQPPSIDFSQGENILFLKWSTNVTKVWEQEMQRRHGVASIATGIEDGFPMRSGDDIKTAMSVDVAAHEVVRREAQTGKKVVAFDNLFTEDELLALRQYIVSHGKVHYDDQIDIYSDNVQWILGFDVSRFVLSKIWTIIKKVVTYVSRGDGDWYPYDVSCNIIRSFDHTRIHTDVYNGQDDEWTFLLYLSPLGSNDFGETAFYTENHDDTELVYQVRAHYGRAVIFEGLIPHAARPPSTAFQGPRYSFAVKMAKTPLRAVQRMLLETLEQFGERLLPEWLADTDSEDVVDEWTIKSNNSVSELNTTLLSLTSRVDQLKEEMKQAMLAGQEPK